MTTDERKAEHAKRLLEDVLIKEAISSMKKACYHYIENSNLSDQESREDYYRMLKTVLLFETELQSYINRGKLAQLNTSQDIKRLIK